MKNKENRAEKKGCGGITVKSINSSSSNNDSNNNNDNNNKSMFYIKNMFLLGIREVIRGVIRGGSYAKVIRGVHTT